MSFLKNNNKSWWVTLRDDLMPFRWHKDDNREAWTRRALEMAAVFTGGQVLPGLLGSSTAASTAAAAGPTMETAAVASQVPWYTQMMANVSADPLAAAARAGRGMQAANTAMSLLSPQQPNMGPMPTMPTMPSAPPPPQDPSYGYPSPSGGGTKPPNIPQEVWDSLDPVKKQELIQKMMGGMS